MGLDFSGPREVVLGLMEGIECSITHDVGGPRNEDLDPVTLEMTKPPGDPQTVYEGPCWVVPLGGEGAELEDARRRTQRVRYQGAIPFDAPIPVIGDILEVTLADPDPELLGMKFTVGEVDKSSALVWRTMTLHLKEDARGHD